MTAVRRCPCGRQFRPTLNLLQKRCMVCIEAFATDTAAAPLAPPPGLIITWPTPPGICANCRTPFDAYPNQRYCSPACRFQAISARQALRQRAASVTGAQRGQVA